MDRNKVEVNPNSIDPVEINVSYEQKERLYEKYDIPKDRCIFMYGGNLGKPQGIEFLLEMLKVNAERTDSYFLIVGTGTEYPKINAWFRKNKPSNAKLMTRLPKEEYDTLLSVCHVGLILLDKRFSIPNYPSRLLPYLLYNLPVIAITDNNTDIGRIAEENGYGISVLHGNIDQTNRAISLLAGSSEKREKMARAGYSFLINNYTTSHSFNIIMKHFSEQI